MKTSLVLLVLASPAAAQFSEGPLTGAPVTVLVGPGTVSPGGAVPPKQFLRKSAGMVPFAGEPVPDAPADPDFSSVALFGSASPAFTVDAFSIGMDRVMTTPPAGGLAYANVASDSWAAIAFSVTRQTHGLPGSLVAQERNLPGGAGADLFTIMLGNQGMPPKVRKSFPVTRPQRALDALEMGLSDGVLPGEITALDILAPHYEDGDPVRSMLPDEPTVYFSVAYDDVFPTVVTPELATWFGVTPPSPATILATTWDSDSATWSTPAPFLTWLDLDLAADDDLDALAVDQENCRALFSIARTPSTVLEDQLQVVQWCGYLGDGVQTGVLIVPADAGEPEEPLVRRLEFAEDGDIDGSCGFDPGMQGDVRSFLFGNPVSALTLLQAMPTGFYRDDDDVLGPHYSAVVTGVPTDPLTPPKTLWMWLASPDFPGYFLVGVPIPLTGLPSPSITLPIPGETYIIGGRLDVLWVILPSAIKAGSITLRINV